MSDHAAGASYVACQLTMQVVQHCGEMRPQFTMISLSSLPLPRANSEGPRRRLSGQQKRDGSQPALEQFR